MPIDFKKTEKELYAPKGIAIIDVPELKYIVADGVGDPNGDAFGSATETLYSLAYVIKMSNKDKLEYVVPPLEGLWWVGCGVTDKTKYVWSIMLRQPGFVDEEIFEAAKRAVAKKKPQLDTSRVRLERFAEGLCVQTVHVGGYDTEPQTIDTMEKFADAAGYAFDLTNTPHTLSRVHHEIYLSDPRKTAADKLKTVIRYPIKAKEAHNENR